ncbi:hypothetical protein ACFYO1_02060 [Nocardia sp. NPDC006044]|uniref:hypothetical protein n=1 Tax=Nocardia sp. NPDC006044 TaxID=3364306 RepID=UPI0036D1D2C2
MFEFPVSHAAMLAASRVVEKATGVCRVIHIEHRRYAYLLRDADRISVGVDRVGGTRITVDRVGSSPPVAESLAHPPSLGKGNREFARARAHYTQRAYRLLLSDPEAAAEIGNSFRADLRRAYFQTRSSSRERSVADIETMERKADYEVARAWKAVTAGFYQDVPSRRALELARARNARGEPVTGLLRYSDGWKGSTANSSEKVTRFRQVLTKMLHEPVDEFWDQYGPGGRHRAVTPSYVDPLYSTNIRRLDGTAILREPWKTEAVDPGNISAKNSSA